MSKKKHQNITRERAKAGVEKIGKKGKPKNVISFMSEMQEEWPLLENENLNNFYEACIQAKNGNTEFIINLSNDNRLGGPSLDVINEYYNLGLDTEKIKKSKKKDTEQITGQMNMDEMIAEEDLLIAPERPEEEKPKHVMMAVSRETYEKLMNLSWICGRKEPAKMAEEIIENRYAQVLDTALYGRY